ncbi:MAG: hypothetical protein DRJ42_16085 [Deltaproteobacteria bacterium]|nr:MAG: hypothetical protein DRJ42_16085 [Deltaproteobacteria bacterium]
MFVRLRFMIGSDAHEESLRAFVNGHLATVVYEGVEETDVRVPLVEGLAEVYIEIPSEEFDVGLNNVHLQSRENRSELGPEGPELMGVFGSFSVIRDGVGIIPTFEDTVGYELGTYQPRYPTTAWKRLDDGEVRGLLFAREHPSPGRPLAVTLLVQADPVTGGRAGHCVDSEVPTDTIIYLALLDGVPVPMGEHDRIIATVPPGEQRIFEFDVDLPEDGERHYYEIIALSGQGRPRRLVGGDLLPPWGVRNHTVSSVAWGGE